MIATVSLRRQGSGASRLAFVRPARDLGPNDKECNVTTRTWLSAAAVLLVVCPFGAVGQGKDDKFDAAKLVGTWKYVSGVKDGTKVDADHFKGQTLTITKDTFTLKSDDATFVMKYELDAKSKPVGIKYTITEGPFGVGAKAEGIVEVNGDDLKVCYAPEGAAPKTFEAKEGSKYHLFVLKRTK
jgi:uncharacterized protein (TIGR03067 family)